MLTRLPVRGVSGARTGSSAFAVVGALVGVAGLVPLVALGAAIPPVAAILAIGAIAGLTGAIHLDGLADTADALIASGPDGAERARKDPAIGVGGAVAIALVLGLEATSLALLVVNGGSLVAGLACVVAATVSRTVPVVLGRLARDHARAIGLGGWFAARATTAAAAVAVGSALLVDLAAAVVLGSVVIPVAGLAGGVGGLAIGLGLVRLRGQLDGDLLGASVELSFALTLVAAATIVGGTAG
jgi:adenosylcobinamide-GDP ribazoletransferase